MQPPQLTLPGIGIQCLYMDNIIIISIIVEPQENLSTITISVIS